MAARVRVTEARSRSPIWGRRTTSLYRAMQLRLSQPSFARRPGAWALHEGGRYEPTRESAVHREGPHHRRARRDVAQLRRAPRGQQADTRVWVIATTYERTTSLHLAHFVCLWPKGCLRKRASRLSWAAARSIS